MFFHPSIHLSEDIEGYRENSTKMSDAVQSPSQIPSKPKGYHRERNPHQ